MKKLKIFLIVLAVIFLLVSVVVAWQFDNIKAIYYAYKYSGADIDGAIDSHYDEIDKYLAENGEYEVRQSTLIEEKLHQMKLLSDDEFMELLTGKKQMSEIFGMDIDIDESGNFVSSDGTKLTEDDIISAKETVSQTSPPDNAETQKTQPTTDEKVSECVARMYVLKSTFESQLDGLFAEAKASYYALTPEQRKSSKSELIKKYYGKATALERSCDSQVNTILAELETVLKNAGESTEIVTKIRNAYNEEKSLKKAYYINLYKS